MEELIAKKDVKQIKNMIFEIRGKEVMLDSDLAKLYGCKNGTKSINLAVKRNIERFPERYCFQLTKDEISRFQNETIKLKVDKRGQNYKYLPYVFTEEGVAMLSSVLRTEVATEVSLAIMDAFVILRKYVSNELLEQKYINNMVLKHNDDIIRLQETFNKFKPSNNEIYFDGMIYDAYSKIVDIISSAINNLIIVDGYADKVVLDMISKLSVNVLLITKTKSLLSKLDLEKYNSQYNNLKIKYDDSFHDRYIIIDNRTIYHLGASINHIGSKTFSINKLEDKEVIELLVNKVRNL